MRHIGKQFIEILPVSWPGAGDEWLHRVGIEVSARNADLHVTGHTYDDTTRPFIVVNIATKDGLAKAPLLVAPLADDTIATFVDTESESDDVIETWRAAGRCAADNLGKGYELHEWKALVGLPAVRFGNGEAFLAEPGQVGPFTLTPAAKPFREIAFNPAEPSLHGYVHQISLPLIVRGKSPGYSAQASLGGAARDLNKLCGLLSIAWNSCMVVRDTPRPIARSLPEPETISWQAGFTDGPVTPIPASKARHIPEWADTAWRMIQTKSRVADAVAIHHEGLRSEVSHPSLALVAFIAAIEGISQIIYREERCTTCRSHLDISAKFRETLRLVLNEEEAAALEVAYSPRSLTVHRGRLHGSEIAAGSISAVFNVWSANNPLDFQMTTVRKMAEASGQLLQLALQDQLPAKKKFDRPA
ncbi:hypothetical protein [Micromonospora chalcea]|uniref:hypothetical protein n=1 Tax=Micromonospora chalcea TaxID=1874 RepID=UPI0037902052